MTTVDLGSSIADPFESPSREHVEDIHRLLDEATCRVNDAHDLRYEAARQIADMLALGAEVEPGFLDLYRELRSREVEARQARLLVSVGLIETIQAATRQLDGATE